MAKTLSNSGITSNDTIQAGHVTQSIDALTGTEAYDITISGSLSVIGTTSGSFIGDGTGLTGVTGEWDGSHNGNASITGSLTVTSDISSSGDVDAANLYTVGKVQADVVVITPVIKSVTSVLQVLDNLDVVGQITASGDISSSADVYGVTGSFQHLLGDGSQITGVTGEWDGSHVGNASITGSFYVSGSSPTEVKFGNTFIWSNPIGSIQFSGSFNNTGSFNNEGPFNNTGSINVSGSINVTGSIITQRLSSPNAMVRIGTDSALNNPGINNTYVGNNAGREGNSSCYWNVAIGDRSQEGGNGHNGDGNASLGSFALQYIDGGSWNVALGKNSLQNTLDGNANIGIGRYAGVNQTTGDGNITIGSGSLGVAGESNQLRIGNGNTLTVISASLATGDIIFASTASAAYFVGDGSGLTDLAAGSNGEIQFNNNGELFSNSAFIYKEGFGDFLVGDGYGDNTISASMISTRLTLGDADDAMLSHKIDILNGGTIGSKTPGIYLEGPVNFDSSITSSGLPTTEPTTTGSMWISGSSVAHPNSGYLMIFNP